MTPILRALHRFGSGPLPALCVLVPAICLVLGCAGSLKQQPTEKLHYVLDVRRAAGAATDSATTSPQPGKGVLKVKRLSVSASFASQELVYRTGESLYTSDYYNQFLVPPIDMLTQNVRQWMEDSRIFGHVVDAASNYRPDYLLETSALSLYGDFSGKTPKAVLAMQFFLLKDTSVEYEIVYSREIRKEVPLAEKSPQGLIKGMGQALSAILAELEGELRAKLH